MSTHGRRAWLLLGLIAALLTGCGDSTSPEASAGNTSDAAISDTATTDGASLPDVTSDAAPLADSLTDSAIPDSTTLDGVSPVDGGFFGADSDAGDVAPPVCPDDDTFFEQTLQAKLLVVKCAGCHNASGLAAGTELVLAPLEAPGATAENQATLTALVSKTLQGVPVLLLRPSGQHPDGHTGGTLAPLGSTDYQRLSEWVDRIAGEDPCAAPDASCATVRPGPPVLRRLTRAEYDRSIESLFGFESSWGSEMTAEVVTHGFDNQADALTVSPLLAEQLQKAGEAIAAQAVAERWELLVPCELTAPDCADTVIATFGARAFRRPLTSDDVSRYRALFDLIAADSDAATAVEAVVATMLQSPHFFYRFELGEPAGELYTLSAWEVASALSYLVWGTLPDEQLFARAADGTILEAAVRGSELDRLLADPRARYGAERFAVQWLDVSLLEVLPKTGVVVSAADRAAMKAEALDYVTDALLAGQPFSALFGDDIRTMTPSLAGFYGLPAPTVGADGRGPVDVSGTPYDAGVLTLGASLFTHAFPSGSSPVHRGKWVRERLLCQELTPPPPGLVAQVPPEQPGTTTRERFALHMSVQPCLDCHRLTDPIGFGLEHFDGVGRYRETESGLAIDDSAAIVATDTLDGDYDGAAGLAEALGGSDEVARCYARQWFRFGFGREPEAALGCLESQISTQWLESGATWSGLLHAMVASPHFVQRQDLPPPPEPPEIPEPDVVEDPELPQPDDVLQVAITIDNDWGEGYCATGTVTNTGSGQVVWAFDHLIEGTLTQHWNAVISAAEAPDGAGQLLTISGVAWNHTIAAGEAASFGFCVDRQGDPPDVQPDALELDVQVSVNSDWAAGFCHNVSVTNTGDTAGVWTVELSTPGPLNNVWDADYSPVDGTPLTWRFVGKPYNQTLAAGATVTFGYCGTKN